MTLKELSRSESRAPEPMSEGRRFLPAADIYESEEELTVMVDLPGADPKDIDVRVEQGILRIHAKVAPRRPEDFPLTLQEYEVGDFVRSFDVGDIVDAQKITAEHRDGVLALHLPKSDRVRPKRIEVKVQ